MAEQDTSQEQAAENQNKGNDSNKSLLIILCLSILVLVATPVVAFFTLKTMLDSEMQDKKTVEETARKDGTKVVLPMLETNIANTEGRRYVKFEILLDVSNAKAANFFREGSEEGGESLLKSAQARVVRIATSQGLETWEKPEGRVEVAKQIKKSFNELLAEEDKKGVVTDVQFSYVLLQ